MPPPCSVLALDLGSIRTGWALATRPDSASPWSRTSGVVELVHGPDGRWGRVDRFARWLTAQLQDHKIELLAVEEIFTGPRDNPGTKHLLHGLYAFARVIALRLGIRVTDVSRFEIFRSCVGWCSKPVDRRLPDGSVRRSRRAPSKDEIRAAILVRHGRLLPHDEADAMATLDLALAELAGTGTPPQDVVEFRVGKKRSVAGSNRPGRNRSFARSE